MKRPVSSIDRGRGCWGAEEESQAKHKAGEGVGRDGWTWMGECWMGMSLSKGALPWFVPIA